MNDKDLGRRASAEPALVADATGAASVSAHSGDGQAQVAAGQLRALADKRGATAAELRTGIAEIFSGIPPHILLDMGFV